MAGIYSIAGLIVTALIVGIAVSHTETATIIDTAATGFANALKAAKP
jgi:hypothetical protein